MFGCIVIVVVLC